MSLLNCNAGTSPADKLTIRTTIINSSNAATVIAPDVCSADPAFQNPASCQPPAIHDPGAPAVVHNCHTPLESMNKSLAAQLTVPDVGLPAVVCRPANFTSDKTIVRIQGTRTDSRQLGTIHI